jgi:hypothetical protein
VKPSNTVQAHLLMFLFEFKMLSIIGGAKIIDNTRNLAFMWVCGNSRIQLGIDF